MLAWRMCGLVMIAGVALTTANPGGLAGQERDRDADWWRWALAEALVGQEITTTQGRRVIIDPDEWFDRNDHWFREGRDEGVPAFCRTGEGHPVFGRDWCIHKGFGLGRVRWDRGDLGDISFRRTPRRDGAILDRPGIEEILGEIILGRMLDRGAGVRPGGDVTGRWLELEDSGARVLQLRSGPRPVAELTDLDGDGAVDVVLWSDAEAYRGEDEEGGRRRPPR